VLLLSPESELAFKGEFGKEFRGASQSYKNMMIAIY
jgi:hypothetical protein